MGWWQNWLRRWTLTAAVQAPIPTDTRLTPRYERWQDEAWARYDTAGEFGSSIEWSAAAMSKVRLIPARQVPGEPEPVPDPDGLTAELVDRFGGGPTGQSQLLYELTQHFGVVGEGWVIGEQQSADGPEEWTVNSADEIRTERDWYSVRVDQDHWRPLSRDAVTMRIYKAHPRKSWLADAASRRALPILQRIDLIDRRFVAEIVSRIASNGLLWLPEEVTFPAKPGYEDAADPFVAELIDTMRKSIQDPGTAAAAAPMIARVPGEVIEKKRIWWMPFASQLDERLLDERNSELDRLASALDLPTDVIKGVADMNHWSAWQMEESGIKIYISPRAETYCSGFTKGWLHPAYKALREPIVAPDGSVPVFWYDPSELTVRPDRSEDATKAYDRIEIGPPAYRREIGFEESDAPTRQETRDMILKKLAGTVEIGLTAIRELSGEAIEAPALPVGGGAPGQPGTEPATPGEGPPATRDEQPPPPGDETP